MKKVPGFILPIVALALLPCMALAGATGGQKDQKALDVLESMAAYTASLDKAVIEGEVHYDARLGEGLIVTNPAELKISIDRPGSLHVARFDGLNTLSIYLHRGELTVYRSEQNYYARARVPDDIDRGMQEALDIFEVETPMMDLIFSDAGLHMIDDKNSVFYLASNSRIRGVDCHHIALRGPEVDVQMWIEEGDMPVPRKMIITMKWEGGSPRHSAFLNWTPKNEFAPGTFEFKPPEGAAEIGFIGATSN